MHTAGRAEEMLNAALSAGISRLATVNRSSTDVPLQVIRRLDVDEVIDSFHEFIVATDFRGGHVPKTVEIITVREPWDKDTSLKYFLRQNLGVEILAADGRKLSGLALGRWFRQLSELNLICRLKGCQFILSSGATRANELISGQSLDSILLLCDINPRLHWFENFRWLRLILSKRASSRAS